MFEDLPLETFGNRIPALTFEVVADAGVVGDVEVVAHRHGELGLPPSSAWVLVAVVARVDVDVAVHVARGGGGAVLAVGVALAVAGARREVTNDGELDALLEGAAPRRRVARQSARNVPQRLGYRLRSCGNAMRCPSSRAHSI